MSDQIGEIKGSVPKGPGDTVVHMTQEKMQQRRKMALEEKQKNLEAKLKRLESAKFEDPAAKDEAIARCKAGIDELQQAVATASKEEQK